MAKRNVRCQRTPRHRPEQVRPIPQHRDPAGGVRPPAAGDQWLARDTVGVEYVRHPAGPYLNDPPVGERLGGHNTRRGYDADVPARGGDVEADERAAGGDREPDPAPADESRRLRQGSAERRQARRPVVEEAQPAPGQDERSIKNKKFASNFFLFASVAFFFAAAVSAYKVASA